MSGFEQHHDECDICGGSRKVICSRCGGNGTRDLESRFAAVCGRCGGPGEVACPDCVDPDVFSNISQDEGIRRYFSQADGGF